MKKASKMPTTPMRPMSKNFSNNIITCKRGDFKKTDNCKRVNMSEVELKPAVFVNKLTSYNSMLSLLKDSAEYKDLYEFLGGGL